MQRASLVETYGPFLGCAAMEDFVAAGTVGRYFEEHWPQAIVATVEDEIIGVAVLQGTLLDLIWVTPARRSQGVGSALMDEAEARAAGAGGELKLEVWRVNRRAVAFYEHRGFEMVRTFPETETGLDKLILRKGLAG